MNFLTEGDIPEEQARQDPPRMMFEGTSSPSSTKHGKILAEAFNVHHQREKKYKSMFKRYGWRGCLFQARCSLERAWEVFWPARDDHAKQENVDDLIDTINYCAMAIQEIRARNRDGWWGYPDGQSK